MRKYEYVIVNIRDDQNLGHGSFDAQDHAEAEQLAMDLAQKRLKTIFPEETYVFVNPEDEEHSRVIQIRNRDTGEINLRLRIWEVEVKAEEVKHLVEIVSHAKVELDFSDLDTALVMDNDNLRRLSEHYVGCEERDAADNLRRAIWGCGCCEDHLIDLPPVIYAFQGKITDAIIAMIQAYRERQ